MSRQWQELVLVMTLCSNQGIDLVYLFLMPVWTLSPLAQAHDLYRHSGKNTGVKCSIIPYALQ